MMSRLSTLLVCGLFLAVGKSAAAASVDQRFRRAWARADVALTSSRF
jgi:hypothetical protein